MNKALCLILDNDLARYHFGENHPFGPTRYRAFKDELVKRQLDKRTTTYPSQLATEQQLLLFHSNDYVDRVKDLSEKGFGFLDYGDTPARKGIYEAACLVVGSTLSALDHIMENSCRYAFTPIAGLHHAGRNHAAGFCVFNDCGIAIEYLRRHYAMQRIAYVDIDAHHGDGVFYAFEEDEDLYIVDFHQDGHTLYPGTGFADETGRKHAAGTKLNIPLPPNSNDDLAFRLWQSAETFIDKARPEFILLQCGVDSLDGDPITQLKLTPAFHKHVAQRLALIANRHCPAHLLAMGGGGYNLENIARGWNAVIEGLLTG